MNPRDCPHGRQLGKCDTCGLIVAEMRIAELEAAIRKHRHDVNRNYITICDTVSPEDIELWALLQEQAT